MEGARRDSESFIGWKSEDGKLEVIGIEERKENIKRETAFRVICTECSKDRELFPLGYFVSTKTHLKNGQKPCACSRYKYTEEQYKILLKRASIKYKFTIHGFVGKYNNINTRVMCECPVHNFTWETTIRQIIIGKAGCKKCGIEVSSKKQRKPEGEVIKACKQSCEQKNHKFIGFTQGYKNSKSLLEYICPFHVPQNTMYTVYLESRLGCPECWRETACVYGGIENRKYEQDFLYVLNFDDKFIKVGRSFNIKQRIRELKTESKINKIDLVLLYSSSHNDVYSTEQNIHNELRNRGFEFKHNTWNSNEIFHNNSFSVLENLLQSSGLSPMFKGRL